MTLLLLLLMFLCVNGSGRLKGSKEGEIESSSLSSQKFPSVGPFFMIPRNSGGFEIGSAIGEKETDSFSLSSDLNSSHFLGAFFQLLFPPRSAHTPHTFAFFVTICQVCKFLLTLFLSSHFYCASFCQLSKKNLASFPAAPREKKLSKSYKNVFEIPKAYSAYNAVKKLE